MWRRSLGEEAFTVSLPLFTFPGAPSVTDASDTPGGPL
jgi:hypothetical protein